MSKEFNFPLSITRAYKKDGSIYLVGEASNTNVDLYETVFTDECQQGFVEDISDALANGKPCQVEAEHEGGFVPFFNIGAITEGTIDNNATKITAKLDGDNPIAVYYYKVLTSTPEENRSNGRPEKLGLSVRGAVKKSHIDFNNEISKNITYFDRVKLHKVGVVEFPGNPDCYAEAIMRSLEKGENIVLDEVKRDDEVVETPEVVTEVKVEDNGEQKETSPATDESGQVSTSESEENKNEEEVVSVETAVEETEAALVVKAEAVDDVVTERSAPVEVITETEVTRGVLAEVMMADDMQEELSELRMTFGYQMDYCQWTSESPVAAAEAMRSLVNEYCDLVNEIVNSYTATRDMSTENTAALQVEDLSDDITLTIRDIKPTKTLRELVTRHIQRSAKVGELVNKLELNKEEQMSKELEEKVEVLTRSLNELSAKVETQNTNKIELETKVADLVKRNEELAAQPATQPALVAETPAEVEKPNLVRDALDNKDVLSAIKFGIVKK